MGVACFWRRLLCVVLGLYLDQASTLRAGSLWVAAFIPGSKLRLLNSFDLGLETSPLAIPVIALLALLA